MAPQPWGASMRQKIFSMNLSVEAISLYLLCCALTDAGAPVTRSALAEKWNGAEEELERELQGLEERQIICRSDPADRDPVYRLVEEKRWR